jgi:hypothetical protein
MPVSGIWDTITGWFGGGCDLSPACKQAQEQASQFLPAGALDNYCNLSDADRYHVDDNVCLLAICKQQGTCPEDATSLVKKPGELPPLEFAWETITLSTKRAQDYANDLLREAKLQAGPADGFLDERSCVGFKKACEIKHAKNLAADPKYVPGNIVINDERTAAIPCEISNCEWYLQQLARKKTGFASTGWKIAAIGAVAAAVVYGIKKQRK